MSKREITNTERWDTEDLVKIYWRPGTKFRYKDNPTVYKVAAAYWYSKIPGSWYTDDIINHANEVDADDFPIIKSEEEALFVLSKCSLFRATNTKKDIDNLLEVL